MKKSKMPTQEDILKALDVAYAKAIDGIPKVSEPIDKMVQDYISKNESVEKAAKSMMNFQIAKCTTSGFITGFGGLITLPVSIPANIGSVLYVQIRMIAATAMMAGYDIHSDQVQTMIYACLAGISLSNVFKQFGVKLGNKAAVKLVEKIPGKALIAINKKVGFRLLTKFGETGMVNLAKLVPGVGAVINGSFDLVETRFLAGRAYRMFIKGDFEAGKDEEELIVDTDDYEEITT